jgi:hypothetical protein
MKLIGNILAFIAALGALAFIIWGGYLGIRFLVDQFGLLDAREMPVLIIASVVYLAGAAIVAGSIRNAMKHNDKNIHPEKAVLYSKFINAWNSYESTPKSLVNETDQWLSHMQLWASDDVLKQYIQFQKVLRENNSSNEVITKDAGKLLLEIRKDLGNKNKGISPAMFKLKRESKHNNKK